MAVKIRLSRGGAKKRPYYRIVVADARSPRDGSFIERVGSYNPMLAKDAAERVQFKEERIKHWLSVGAQPTDRVARMMAKAGLGDAPVINEQTKQDKPKAKALERVAEKEEKAKAAAEAAAEAKAAAAEEAAAKAEAPVEEAPAEEAPAEETVAEEVPAEEAAAKAEAPVEEAPAEEAPAEEAATEEAPAEEESKEEAAG